VTVHTTSQKMARQAYSVVDGRLTPLTKERRDKYTSFAREFPTLVHSCGLAQAVAFARAKGEHQEQYVDDLAAVLSAAGHERVNDSAALAEKTRSLPLTQYLRLSRDALAAAVWVKRYVEAAGEN